MDLLIVNNSSIKAPRKHLAQAFELIENELHKKKLLKPSMMTELTIVFLNTAPAKKMNHQFRKKNYATDVLSFSSDDPESYGELIICSQVAAKQAKVHKLSYRDELVYLTLHGFLHLLGYDHEKSKKEEKIMFAIQDQIFAKVLKQKL